MEKQQMHDAHCYRKCFSWTAVFVGALVGVGLSFLLSIFNVAIGLSVFTMSKEGMITVAIGGLLGLAIGVIVAMFMAGFTAGYLGRPYCVRRNMGVLYGFGAWVIALLLTVMFTAHLGRYISYYSNFIANPSTVVIATDNVAPAVTASLSSQQQSMTIMTMNSVKATQGMAMGAFIVFILFCLGALASCFGGHYGMSCKDDDAMCR